jgi:hypothetical protein
MGEQRILRASTQTLVTYPRLHPSGVILGQPSAATVKLQTPAVQETTFSAAVADALSTTTQGAHQEGDDHITLSASVALVAGRRYLIELASGRSIEVEALEGGTQSQLWTVEPLPCDIANGSAVRGFAVTKVLTAVQTDQVGDALALFRATVNGSIYEWSESFRIANKITSPRLTPTRLTHAFPIMSSLRDTNDIDYEAVIDAAWDHRIVPLLAARKILDEDVISDEALVPLHALACVLHIVEVDPRFSSDYVARMREAYDKTMDTTFSRVDFAVRDQTDLTPRSTGAEPRWGIMRATR